MRYPVLISIGITSLVLFGLSSGVFAQTGSESGHSAPSTGVNVAPGPLEAQRADLYNRIQSAKLMGVGISTYMMVFNHIENMVKSGQDEAQIQKRIDSVSQSLNDQLKRMEVLQTEAAAGPTVIQGGNSGSGGGSGMPPGPSGGMFGDVPGPGSFSGGGIPPALQDKLPEMMQNPQFREKLQDPSFMRNAMRNPALRDKLEQLKGKYGGMLPGGMNPDALERKIQQKGIDPGMIKQMEGLNPDVMQNLPQP